MEKFCGLLHLGINVFLGFRIFGFLRCFDEATYSFLEGGTSNRAFLDGVGYLGSFLILGSCNTNSALIVFLAGLFLHFALVSLDFFVFMYTD